jgi:ketosteroid isomerase-like protein
MDANDKDARQEILELERHALTRWGNGDPSGFVELLAPDVVYFDPFIDRRIDGSEALNSYYEALRGKIFAKRFELIEPLVQQHGQMAVLTFNFVCLTNHDIEQQWNCTEVFRRDDAGWRIIQSHWSFANPSRRLAASLA